MSAPIEQIYNDAWKQVTAKNWLEAGAIRTRSSASILFDMGPPRDPDVRLFYYAGNRFPEAIEASERFISPIPQQGRALRLLFEVGSLYDRSTTSSATSSEPEEALTSLQV